MYKTSQAIFENTVRSTLLLVLTAALVFAASYALGYALGDITMGLGIGIVACIIVIPLQMMMTKMAILKITRGRPANPADRLEARLLAGIDRLAKNAGLSKTPPLYVTDAKSPNAFASGLGEGSAFVCVTKGLVECMTEEEIFGVIGHELGHVKHGDIRLNTIVNGLTTVLSLLCVAIEIIARSNVRRGRRSREDSGAGLGVILLLAALLLRPLVGIISALLQLAISRKREFAADAFAVEVNGSPKGIGDALETLSQTEKQMSRKDTAELGGSRLASMYFSFPSIGELFATHPPLAERIRRIREMG